MKKKHFLTTTLILLSSFSSIAQNTFPNEGNVGIGTASPLAKFQIIGPETDSGGSQFIIGNTNAANLRMGTNASYSWIQSHGGRPLRLNELGNDIIFCPTAGQVGLGKLNPTAKLDIGGNFSKSEYGIIIPTVNVFTVNPPAIGTGGTIALGGKTGNATADYAFAYITGAKESNGPNDYAGYFAIHTVSPGGNGEVLSANYERMRISSTGNVGIGTVSPREKLSVNGKIRAHEIKVETTNWPDYVFDKNYQLTSLPTLEKYLKANKHLPEVPSAKEVEENGLDLGRTQALFLKKLEELTLILIEKDKQIQQQQRELNALKKQFGRLKEKNK